MFGCAKAGPAHIITDVLTLIIKVDIEQRKLAGPYRIIEASTHFIGMRFLRTQPGGGTLSFLFSLMTAKTL